MFLNKERKQYEYSVKSKQIFEWAQDFISQSEFYCKNNSNSELSIVPYYLYSKAIELLFKAIILFENKEDFNSIKELNNDLYKHYILIKTDLDFKADESFLSILNEHYKKGFEFRDPKSIIMYCGIIAEDWTLEDDLKRVAYNLLLKTKNIIFENYKN